MTTRINLRAERLRRGLSARAAAEAMAIKEDVLLYAERNPDSRPLPHHAAAIARFYSVDPVEQWPEPQAA